MLVSMTYGVFNGQNMSSSISEIGSEFWIGEKPETLLTERDGIFVLSGRTAIDLILQDILKIRPVNSVYMPGWCCESMLAPFVDRGIKVVFYDVKYEDLLKYELDESVLPDVFYLTNYFGYANTLPIEVVKHYGEKGAVIVYDRTHSFPMEDEAYQALADYSFASIRKWMGVVGGAVVNGLSKSPELKYCSYVEAKEEAMHDKWRYLNGDTSIAKDDFLNAFASFGHCLTHDYRDYAMDDLSYSLYKLTDMDAMKKQRRRNATYLHTHLSGVRFLDSLTNDVFPLFVPVFFETEEKRNAVRKRLIDENIYCPIHWPKPKQIPDKFDVNKIYYTELSLICDQRYGLDDMQRIVKIIQTEI